MAQCGATLTPPPGTHYPALPGRQVWCLCHTAGLFKTESRRGRAYKTCISHRVCQTPAVTFLQFWLTLSGLRPCASSLPERLGGCRRAEGLRPAPASLPELCLRLCHALLSTARWPAGRVQSPLTVPREHSSSCFSPAFLCSAVRWWFKYPNLPAPASGMPGWV